MKSTRHRKLRIAMIALGAVVALFLAVAALLHLPGVQSRFWEMARGYVEREWGLTVTSSDFGYNLFALSFTFEDLTVRSTREPEPPLATASRARIDLGLAALVAGNLYVDRASFDDLNLQIRLAEGGGNLPLFDDAGVVPDPGAGGFPAAVTVRDFRVDGAALALTDTGSGLEVELPAWQLAVSGSGQTHNVGLDIAAGGRLRAGDDSGDAELGLGAVGLSATVSPDTLELISFDVSSEAGTLSASGMIGSLQDPEADIQVRADLDAGALAALAGLEADISGRILTEARVRGDSRSRAVAGRTRGEGFEAADYGPIEVDSTWAWAAGENRVDVESAALGWRNGSLGISGQVGLASGVPTRLDVEADQLDMESLTGILDLPVQVASRLSGTFTASWPGMEVTAAAGAGRFSLESTRQSAAAGLLPVSGRFVIEAGPETATLEIASLDTLGVSAAGQASVESWSGLEGAIRISVPDPGTSIAEIRSLSDADPDSWTAAFSGMMTLTANLGGTVSDPAIDFSANAPSLGVGGDREFALDLGGSYAGQTLRIGRARLTADGESLEVAGTVDLAREPAALDLTASSDRLPISALLAAAGVGVPVGGAMDLSASIGGTLGAPRGEVQLVVSELEAWGEALGRISTVVDIDPDRARLTALEWVKFPDTPSRGRAQGAGEYVFESGRYEVHIEGQGFDFRDLRAAGGRPLQGLAGFVVEGSGTLEEPALRVALAVDEASWGPVAIGEADLDARLDGELLEAGLDVPLHGLAVDVDLRLAGAYPFQAAANIGGFDLAVLQPLVEGTVVSGSVTAELEASGDAASWLEAAAAVRVSSLEAAFGGQAFAIGDPAVVRYDDRRLRIEPFSLLTGGQTLRVSGEMPLGRGQPDGVLDVQGAIDLASLVPILEATGDLGVEGLLELDVALEGSFERLVLTASAGLRNASVAPPVGSWRVTEIDADLRVSDGRLVLERLDARAMGAPVSASGSVPLAALSDIFPSPGGDGLAASLMLEADSVPIGSLPGVPEDIGGVISVSATGATPRFALDAVEARAEILTRDLSLGDVRFGQTAPIVATVRGGRVEIEPFALSGPADGRITGAGTLDLAGTREIRFDLSGETAAAVAGALAEDLEADGRIDIDLEVRGTLADPSARGSLGLSGGAFALSSPELEANSLDASLTFTSDTIVLESLSGSLNGGDLEARGSIGYAGNGLTDVQLEISASEVFLEVPAGLQTLTSTAATIRSNGNLIEVAGSTEVLEGHYTERISLSELVSDYLSGDGEVSIDLSEENELLSRVRFDVAIDTLRPVVVDNNIARLAAEANLNLVGSWYDPGLVGRVTIAEGGTLEIQETRFIVERGLVDFEGQNRIEPVLDIVANSTVGGVDVVLQVSGGTATEIETTLTSPSDPEYTEPDLIALLVTGQTLQEVRGAELNVARSQVLSYLTGAVGSRISAGAEEALGLSRVQIEPNLIASESDPGARLTVGQNLTPRLELIYSMDLTDSNDQIWIAEYDVTRRFVTRGIKQEDNSYRFELRHDLTFGGPERAASRAAAEASQRVLRIDLAPETLAGRNLRDVLDLEAGSDYTFLEVREAVERLGEFFAQLGYLEARVISDRTNAEGGFTLDVQVQSGPQVAFDFRGATPDGSAVRAVREAWRAGRFDSVRARNAIREIRRALVEDGYVDARADFETSTADDLKRVVFTVESGPRYRRVDVGFSGLTAFEADAVREDLRDADLWLAIHVEPERVQAWLADRFRAAGYLDIEVGDPVYSPADGARMAVTIPIREGPRYRVGDVEFEGNDRFGRGELLEDIMLEGQTFTPDLLRLAVQQIEESYWNRGYNDARVDRRLTQNREAGTIDIVFGIDENRQDIIREILISGNSLTNEDLVRTQLRIGTGEPLDFAAINQARRRLYDTGAYSLVRIDSVDIGEAAGGGGDEEDLVRLTIDLREVPPVGLDYGGFYDTERGAGVIADLQTRNWLGSARTLGVRGRWDGTLRELRTYFGQPQLLRMPVRTNIVGFFTRELDTEVEGSDIQFNTDRLGFSAQQEALVGDRFVFDYGYRFANTHQYPREAESDPFLPLELELNVATLTASATRDTRDDLLDATRGSFVSQALAYGAGFLGSELSVFRWSAQGFWYRPLSDPTEIPYSGGTMKSRFSYAGGVRVGVAVGLGGDIVPRSERFLAGGGTSIRGFAQDLVGPVETTGDGKRFPLGGDAMLVINNELRIPLINVFDGVMFLDAGNVYSRVDAFDPLDLRSSAGLGLRARTPWLLLRADYGWKLGRRPGESAGEFFFSIGQAF